MSHAPCIPNIIFDALGQAVPIKQILFIALQEIIIPRDIICPIIAASPHKRA